MLAAVRLVVHCLLARRIAVGQLERLGSIEPQRHELGHLLQLFILEVLLKHIISFNL